MSGTEGPLLLGRMPHTSAPKRPLRSARAPQRTPIRHRRGGMTVRPHRLPPSHKRRLTCGAAHTPARAGGAPGRWHSRAYRREAQGLHAGSEGAACIVCDGRWLARGLCRGYHTSHAGSAICRRSPARRRNQCSRCPEDAQCGCALRWRERAPDQCASQASPLNQVEASKTRRAEVVRNSKQANRGAPVAALAH